MMPILMHFRVRVFANPAAGLNESTDWLYKAYRHSEALATWMVEALDAEAHARLMSYRAISDTDARFVVRLVDGNELMGTITGPITNGFANK